MLESRLRDTICCPCAGKARRLNNHQLCSWAGTEICRWIQGAPKTMAWHLPSPVFVTAFLWLVRKRESESIMKRSEKLQRNIFDSLARDVRGVDRLDARGVEVSCQLSSLFESIMVLDCFSGKSCSWSTLALQNGESVLVEASKAWWSGVETHPPWQQWPKASRKSTAGGKWIYGFLGRVPRWALAWLKTLQVGEGLQDQALKPFGSVVGATLCCEKSPGSSCLAVT